MRRRSHEEFFGSVMISGVNGAGKTSLATYLAKNETFNYKRIRYANAELEKVCKEFDIPFKPMTHFTYSTEKMFFKETGYYIRESHDIDARKVGIQSEAPEGVECCFIPTGAVVILDEYQSVMPSRDGGEDKGKNYQFSVHEKKRHNDNYFIMTTPEFILVDKRIRNISSGIYIHKRTNEKLKDGREKITWHVSIIPYGQINAVLSRPEEKRYKGLKKEKIVCYDDIYDMYDSKSCKKLFTKGLTREQILRAMEN